MKKLNLLTLFFSLTSLSVFISQVHAQQLTKVSSPPFSGTFFSAKFPDQPPVPFNFGLELGLEIFSFGNVFIVDDRQAYSAQKFTSPFAMNASEESGPPASGKGGGEETPDNFDPAYDYSSSDLWLEIFNGTNTAPITLHNTTQGVRYQLLSRPEVAQPPWLVEQTLFGAVGTNTLTTVPFNERPILFFWAGVDTDGDGLIDYLETLYGTDSQITDSDSDGVNDYIEVVQGRNPTNGAPVSDTTGLVNLQVYTPLR